jgi:hypothetical protein
MAQAVMESISRQQADRFRIRFIIRPRQMVDPGSGARLSERRTSLQDKYVKLCVFDQRSANLLAVSSKGSAQAAV